MNRNAERNHTLLETAPLVALAREPGVFEVCVNTPGVAWIETAAGWSSREVNELGFGRLMAIAKVVASWGSQRIGADAPVLSATLPGGERIQVVIPPAVAEGTVSVTIRKPGSATFSVAELADGGLFREVAVGQRPMGDDSALVGFLARGDHRAFLEAAVTARKNIIISGATGSGKTTLSKALIRAIPMTERIITIEDTPELEVPQPNHVRLYYSKGGQGVAKTGPKELLESCLRMRPDRILLQELRDGTAFYYLRNVNSGHPGSITTVHADSCGLAFEQLTLLVKESAGGGDLDRGDIRDLLQQMVDIVIQCKRVGGAFRVTEIQFDPSRKRLAA